MKRIFWICLAYLAIVLPALAQVSGGWQLFNTGASGATCGPGVSHTLSWQNPYGAPIHIVQIQIWNGLVFGQMSDVSEIIIRRSDHQILIDGGHDDYGNGGPERIQKENWGGGTYMEVPANDWLDFTFACTPAGQIGGWVVTVWTR